MTVRKEFPSVAKITQTGTGESEFARFSADRHIICRIERVFRPARRRTVVDGAVLSYLSTIADRAPGGDACRKWGSRVTDS